MVAGKRRTDDLRQRTATALYSSYQSSEPLEGLASYLKPLIEQFRHDQQKMVGS